VPLFRWFILRRVRQEPVRAGLTILGIALGVAVVLAIRLANQSATAGFAAALDTVAGKTSLEIVGAGVGVAEEQLAGLGWLREWGDVSPVIEGEASALVAQGRGEPIRVLGVDILRDRQLREYQLLRLDSGRTKVRPYGDDGGRTDRLRRGSGASAEAGGIGNNATAEVRPYEDGGSGEPTAAQFLQLLVDRDAIVLSERFAQRHGLQIGSRLVLGIGDQRLPLKVRGLLRAAGPARVLDGNFALMDIAAAQLAFARLGRVDRVDVRLSDPSRLDEAERAIAARLPPGLGVQRPARRGEQVEKMLAAFQFNLAALSWVALLVGLFLVYNTVATSVIARRDEIGMLRALGTTRGGVVGLFVGEGAALAIAGCALGIPLGWAFAAGATRLTSATVTTLYVAQAAGTPALTWLDALMGLAVGLPLSLVAAAAPAIEASRVTPLQALRRADARGEAPGRRLRWTAAGGACLLLAVAAAQLGPVNGLPIFGFAAALLVVLGLALLVPAVLRLLAAPRVAAAASAVGIEGRLAVANLAGSVPRLGVSVAALAVSLAMMVAIAVLIGSFRETVIHWVGQTLRADLFVSTARRSSLDAAQATISPALESAIASDPAVAAIDPFRSLTLRFRDRLIVLGSGDFDVLLDHGALVFKQPADGIEAMRSAIGRDAVVVSEALSLRFGVAPGDTIDLPTAYGERPFDVAAVYYDYATDRGVVAMDYPTFTKHYGELRPTSLSIYLREGLDPAAERDRLMDALSDRHRVFIHTNASLRAEVLRIFDATFAITYGLEAVAILVAMLGITGTLITLMLERRHELAILRLVGTDLGQVRRIVVIEAGLLGVVSQVMGLVGGFALSLILIYVINVQSFGWTIQFHVPVAFLLQAIVVLLAATMIAGLYPARVAAGFTPAAEVTTE
jgi:putative ABC transport system permease protein